MAQTDGSIDWVEFQDQVKAWVEAEGGFTTPRAYWQEEARPNETALKVWAELNILNDEDLGVDDFRVGDHPTPSAGAELQTIVAGQRLVTVSIRVKARRDQRAAKTARHYISLLRTSLRDPKVRATYFQPFGIAVVLMQPLQNLDFTDQRRRVSLGNMDVQFAVAVNRLGDETYIEKTLVSSDVKDPEGNSLPASLQLDDVVMP